jgi:ketosteroid isomerase-like protein
MKRRFYVLSLFVLLLAVFAQAQETTHTKVYAIAGAPAGAVGEYETPDQLKVLDEFIQSKYLEKYDQALLTNDKAALDSMIADHAVWVSERFGKGEHLDKAGVLATFGDKKVVSVAVHVRDHVRLRAMGPDEILMTGNSSSVLKLQGKQSRTNRLFAQIYKKIDGRWQCTLHSIMDYDGLLPGSKP